MIALNTTAIAWVIFVVISVGWVTYYFLNKGVSRAELGSEREMAPNRKAYYDDEGEKILAPVRKFFEIPAAGAAMLCTPPVGFPGLGFRDGETHVEVEPEALPDIVADLRRGSAGALRLQCRPAARARRGRR